MIFHRLAFWKVVLKNCYPSSITNTDGGPPIEDDETFSIGFGHPQPSPLSSSSTAAGILATMGASATIGFGTVTPSPLATNVMPFGGMSESG